MSVAYDTLRDGMDMTGLAQAKSDLLAKAKRTTNAQPPYHMLQGVAAYDMIEHMEEVQDHPAELNGLRAAEIQMYGNDRKLREAVFTWSEDAQMQASNDQAVLKNHDIRTAVGSMMSASSSTSQKERIDDETMNALLDETVDFGATIHEDPNEMLRRRPNART